MDRSTTVERFRERLGQVMKRSGQSRTGFARRVGIDRSTLSQILSPSTDRLPRVETLAAIAMAEHVSLDWLVGLSEEGPMAASILEVEAGARSPSDQRLADWRSEAIGYKIRLVPANLPDLLRTDAVIEYEYRESAAATPEQRRLSRREHLLYERRPETDTEVCTSRQLLETFARGVGLWSGLSAEDRREQLALMADLTEELYPTFRWFLYDGLKRYSVPLTLFGPKRAVIYTGSAYLVFNGAEHIRLLTAHFDDLIRAAVVQPTELVALLRELRDEI
jgi:transcriptional regulator with XRE-family HTH domain